MRITTLIYTPPSLQRDGALTREGAGPYKTTAAASNGEGRLYSQTCVVEHVPTQKMPQTFVCFQSAQECPTTPTSVAQRKEPALQEMLRSGREARGGIWEGEGAMETQTENTAGTRDRHTHLPSPPPMPPEAPTAPKHLTLVLSKRSFSSSSPRAASMTSVGGLGMRHMMSLALSCWTTTVGRFGTPPGCETPMSWCPRPSR